ncbi:androglobin [Aplysia californica]|uniref:Globin n=1 Tax=Aplysia californica TaxID=6500 RepID=A0ABM1VXX3_APLCA|nr:androglobin [Aplysia californica]
MSLLRAASRFRKSGGRKSVESTDGGTEPGTEETARSPSSARGSFSNALAKVSQLKKLMDAASVAASAGGQDSKRPKFTIWPEWNDADVNAEKWGADAAKKEDKKGKSPTVSQHYFEDPDGKIEMPPSLRVDSWKRPADFLMDKVPVIVDTDHVSSGFDLIANNEHLHESEFLRYCISQVMALWDMCSVPVPPDVNLEATAPGDDPSHSWRPWEHIYALCKAGKGPHLPLYNSHGKYVVRLYWMGCWRKITIDDTVPFDDQGRMLLPSTTLTHELWPMLLTKALIKVASLDYSGGNPSQEFGDMTVLQCLTGWIPEAIPLLPSHMAEVWQLMKKALPEWTLPEQEWEKPPETTDVTSKESVPSEGAPKEEKLEKEGTQKDMKDGKAEKGKDGKEKGKDGKEKEKGKDDKKDKKDKDKEKDKDKGKEKSSLDDIVLPEKPELVMFATYSSTPKFPVKVSVLGEMADASEKLRQNGLSHQYPHPVCLTQTRSCPLEPPPPPVVIPSWKLIRPRKRKSPPHDEPVADPEPPKEIQCLEITSAFVNYKVSPVPIPTDTHRPKSSLERGGARSRADTEGAIEEMDENAPTPRTLTPEPEPAPPVEEPKEEEEPPKEKPGTPKRKASGKAGRGSASKERSQTKRPESRQSNKTDDGKPDKVKESQKAEVPAPGGPSLGGNAAGGLAPPANVVLGPDGEPLPAEEEEEPPKEKPGTPKRKASGKASRGSASKERSQTKRPESRQSNKTDDGKPDKVKESQKAEVPAPGGPSLGGNAAGGLAPPANVVLGPDGEPLPAEEVVPEPPPDNTPKPKKAWMDFDIFCKCFRTLYIFHKSNTYLCNQYYSDLKSRTLYIFHKSNTYLCNQYYSDLKSVTPSSTTAPSKTEKRPPQATSTRGSLMARASLLLESHEEMEELEEAPNDGSPFYLFVDNLAQTEIVVSYSVLSRWFDPPLPLVEEKKALSQIKQGKEKDLDKEPTNASISLDSVVGEQKPPPPVQPGTLVAEPYSWKSLVTGQPILRLRTTGTKSAVLTLPPGRHVLRFMMSSPLGHHVHMCSTVNFVFGDEETVMPQLTNESCRFRDNAVQVIMNLGKCILAFKDPTMLTSAWAELVASHCPYLEDKQMSKTHHFQVFNEALYQMLKKTVKDIMSPDIAFAWRAFTFDATTSNILAIPVGSRPATQGSNAPGGYSPPFPGEGLCVFNEALYQMLKKTVKDIMSPDIAFAWRAFTFDATTSNILAIPVGSRPGSQVTSEEKLAETKATGSASVRGSAKPSSKKHSTQADAGEAEKPENPWANREASVEEQIQTVKIQKVWRGYYVRKMKAARTPGTEENLKVAENLTKSWSQIESTAEENGLVLLREMFKRDPDIMSLYPFYQDEWNKISYSDYKGVYQEQPSLTWFIVFRDIFFVQEEMLLVPRLYVPIGTCMLRVIDNDTGQEVPRVFQKVAPYVYKKNKKGYSFVAEARTVEQPITSGNWRMRLIGSLNALPVPQSGEVCCNFVTKEIRDYYVPNVKNTIFRQAVKVTEDHFSSLQVNTSKPDVYIKLSVLDNEEEVISAVGKGHVVIPAFTFLKDITQEDIENRRSSSRALPEEEEGGEDEPEGQKNQPTEDAAVRGSIAAPATKAEKSTSKLKRTESAVSTEQQPPSRSSMRSDAELAERLEDSRPHKYIIQATVLQNSWPLSESSWRFVQMLKEMEKNELKVFGDSDSDSDSSESFDEEVTAKERPPSPPKVEKTPAAAGGKAKPKAGKDKGGKDKGQEGKGSRPSSQQFDITKPNWTLRVVSDAVTAEEIEVKKDTERADEIRAMKKAWEDAEPGRAAKALQSRLKYLNSHTVKLGASEDDQSAETAASSLTTGTGPPTAAESGATVTEQESLPGPQTPVSLGEHFESETTLTLEPPPPPAAKEMLEPLDVTPFVRKTLAEPRYLGEEELHQLLEKRQKDVAEYKAFREQVERWRDADRQMRNKTKLQQLEQCQALQATLDAARERINIPRESIRQRFLDAEQKRIEELANQEAAMKAELEAKSPKGRKKSPSGKKKK